MTKALFVIPNLTPGGIQTQVLLLAKYLKNELNIDVTIWGIKTQQTEFTDILKTERIKYSFKKEVGFIFSKKYFQQNRLKQLRAWIYLIKILKKEKFDIILPYGGSGLIFNIIKPIINCKVSFWFERGGHPSPRKRKFDIYHFLAKKSKPVYVANSEHGRRALAIIENIPIQKIQVIKNAYVPKTKNSNIEKWENNLEDLLQSKIVVTMIANFFDGKDHKTVIHAWNSLKNKNNALLVFAGLGGPGSCHRNFENAKGLVKSLNLQSNILFLGSIKNINKLLNLTDIGLLSSESEGCPNAVLEYMGHGLPVIGTDIPGIREVLPLENQKFLFPVGNIQKCAELLHTFIENQSLRKTIGQINKKHVYDTFAPEKMFEAYKKIFIAHKLL